MNNKMLPKVAVCLAAYNGALYLTEQLNSILEQADISVTLFVSVDASSDGTEAWIDSRAEKDNRIIVLPHGEHFGNAAKNFYRLMKDVNLTDFDYLSFADQDDIWLSGKLIHHIRLIKKHQADGVSSNVIAFWPDGVEKLILKSQPQKELDYLFESAGPGCTFLMTPWLVDKVRLCLQDENNPARDVALHDWLTYAICRSSGKRWFISDEPTVRYRQHDNNVVGANKGLLAKLARLKKLKQGWYRTEVLKITNVCFRVSNDSRYQEVISDLSSKEFFARFNLLKYAYVGRRSFFDACILGLLFISGLF